MRAEGRFPGRRPSLTEQQREYIRAERSKGVSQRELAKRLEVSRWTIQQVERSPMPIAEIPDLGN